MSREQLRTIVRFPSITRIRAENSTLIDEDLHELSKATKLTTLSLHNSRRITSKGMKHLARLAALERLQLNGTAITDEGLELESFRCRRAHLARIRYNSRRALFGCGKPATLVSGLKNLRKLEAHHTALTDLCIPHILRFRELQVLHLGTTHISDSGLEKLGRLKRLELVQVQNTKVTAAGVAKLRRALPKCKIVWDGYSAKPETKDQYPK